MPGTVSFHDQLAFHVVIRHRAIDQIGGILAVFDEQFVPSDVAPVRHQRPHVTLVVGHAERPHAGTDDAGVNIELHPGLKPALEEERLQERSRLAFLFFTGHQAVHDRLHEAGRRLIAEPQAIGFIHRHVGQQVIAVDVLLQVADLHDLQELAEIVPGDGDGAMRLAVLSHGFVARDVRHQTAHDNRQFAFLQARHADDDHVHRLDRGIQRVVAFRIQLVGQRDAERAGRLVDGAMCGHAAHFAKEASQVDIRDA